MGSIWPPEYKALSNTGADDRKGSLEYLQSEKTKPTFKFISFKTEINSITSVGDAFLVTATWQSESVGSEFPSSIPHRDSGVYSGVVERRDGRWIFLEEHTSEMPHDRALMLKELAKARKDVIDARSRLIQTSKLEQGERDKIRLLIGRTLADEYSLIRADGGVSNKSSEIERYQDLNSMGMEVDISEQKVKITSNTSAIETGVLRSPGRETIKGGDIGKYRCTLIWIWRDMRWQIVSEQRTMLGAK